MWRCIERSWIERGVAGCEPAVQHGAGDGVRYTRRGPARSSPEKREGCSQIWLSVQRNEHSFILFVFGNHVRVIC